MTDAEAKQTADVAMTCAFACVSRSATVTLSLRGPRPKGFPRGELLSVGTDGSKNYALDPVKVLSWLRSRAAQEAAAK